MIICIDQKAEEPLYLQIRNQVIAAIARGELVPGAALPSVRALASDLGINLHTVNKAYAVLRDEGYVLMRGRSGAYIADPCEDDRADRARIELAKMEDGLFELALAHRARGGSWGEFLECAQAQAARAYGVGERPDADPGPGRVRREPRRRRSGESRHVHEARDGRGRCALMPGYDPRRHDAAVGDAARPHGRHPHGAHALPHAPRRGVCRHGAHGRADRPVRAWLSSGAMRPSSAAAHGRCSPLPALCFP